VDLVLSLLANGANPNDTNECRLSMFHVAVWDRTSWCRDLDVKNHMTIVDALFHYGANVNQADNFGFTALMMAANTGNTLMVRWLIRHGADPTKLDFTWAGVRLSGGYGYPVFKCITAADHVRRDFALRDYLLCEEKWVRRKSLVRVIHSIRNMTSDTSKYRVLQGRDVMGIIFSFL